MDDILVATKEIERLWDVIEQQREKIALLEEKLAKAVECLKSILKADNWDCENLGINDDIKDTLKELEPYKSYDDDVKENKDLIEALNE